MQSKSKEQMLRKRYLKIGESILIFSLLIYFFCSEIKAIPFHGDEGQWIPTSSVFEAYISGDFSSPLWNESYWTLTQPPISRYIIGVGRTIGGFNSSYLNSKYNWKEDYEQNVAGGRIPSDALLVWSRFPMAILAAISMFIGFLLLKKVAGQFSSYIWLGLVLTSWYFLHWF